MAQFGRAPRSGRGGRKFESCHLDQKGQVLYLSFSYFKNTTNRINAVQTEEKASSAEEAFLMIKPYKKRTSNARPYDRVFNKIA